MFHIIQLPTGGRWFRYNNFTFFSVDPPTMDGIIIRTQKMNGSSVFRGSDI